MILITGASGFIGRNLATYLHEKGENVVASGRKERDDFFSKNGIPYVKLNISKHEDYSNIEKKNIKKIVHLAAIVPTKKKLHSTDEYISINGNGILHLLEYCVQNKVEKFVNISTLSVYGAAGVNGVNENANLQPCGNYADYAIAKILAELFTNRYTVENKLSAITLRLGYVFGDYRKEHLLLPRLLKKALDGNEIVIEGKGEYIFDLVYIGDCIKAIELALNTQNTGIYNIGSGVPVSLNQIVSVIDSYAFRLTKKHVPIRHADLKDLKKGYVMSLEKSKNYLCYQPQYKGVEVVQQVLNDYHANEEIIEEVN